MELSYSLTTKEGSLRTLHIIVINGERLETTRQKEVLVFAKARLATKNDWKLLRSAVNRGESLEIAGGKP